jgi:hypothetical protein
MTPEGPIQLINNTAVLSMAVLPVWDGALMFNLKISMLRRTCVRNMTAVAFWVQMYTKARCQEVVIFQDDTNEQHTGFTYPQSFSLEMFNMIEWKENLKDSFGNLFHYVDERVWDNRSGITQA